MAATAQYQCKNCGGTFTARTADRERGWARFCSKSCKAVQQVKSGGASGPGHIGNSKPRKRLPRPDGFTPMLYKDCAVCGAAAVNGVRTNDRDNPVEWLCAFHFDTMPITDGHGQWE